MIRFRLPAFALAFIVVVVADFAVGFVVDNVTATFIVAYPASRWVRNARPWESPTRRAHRICEQCGLDPVVVDGLIDTMQHSTLTREQSLELFFSTFDEPAAAELCVPCAETIMHAAGPMENGL